MTLWSQRLAELNITLPAVPTPAAAYVPAMRVGNEVWTSGQLPSVAGSLLATGVVGEGAGYVSPEKSYELARIAGLNALAAAADIAGGIDNIVRILKITGYVASEPGFTAQPKVINGASELMQQIFGDAGVHARSAVGVAALPLGAPVEVELIAEIRG